MAITILEGEGKYPSQKRLAEQFGWQSRATLLKYAEQVGIDVKVFVRRARTKRRR